MSPPILYPDADLENADWSKSRSWDLNPDPAWWETQATAEDIQRIVRLPAFAAAPPAIAKIIEQRLTELAD